MIRKKRTSWVVSAPLPKGGDPKKDKITLVRPRKGSEILLRIDLPKVQSAFVEDAVIMWEIQLAIDHLQEELKSRPTLPPVHEDKITWGSQGEKGRIYLEIGASRIPPQNRNKRASIDRSIKTALKAIQAAVDSPDTISFRYQPEH